MLEQHIANAKDRSNLKDSTPIDAFVQARLEEKGLTVTPQADKRTLVRRVSFDLLGLPPTPEQIEAFVNDGAPEAWERLIDVTVFLTDLERDFPTYNRIYAEYFGKVQPCRTTVGVARLPGPIAIELKCIATLP